jgi:toxin YoeB
MEGRTVSAAKGRRRGKGEQRREMAPEKRQWECVVDRNCLEDLRWWLKTAPKTAARVMELMDAVLRDPLEGIGKPEQLKGLGPTHSRRISGEHRLVYTVLGDRVVFLQARYHY